MAGKIALLLVVYGGLSVAALLLLVIGVAIARTRAEVIAMTAICAVLVLVHAAELVYLAELGQTWQGDGIDPLLVAGGALMCAAGAATAAFVRRRGGGAGLSGGTR